MSKTIYLDAGHGGAVSGGYDPGAVDGVQPAEGDRLNTRENDVAVDFVRRLGHLLRERGYRVLGAALAGEDREDFREAARAANAAGVDLLLSVHCNAATDPTARGFEILYRSESGRALGLRIEQQVREQIVHGRSKWLSRAEPLVLRGLKLRTDLHVLNATRMVAALVELGFITHPQEEARLHDAHYLQALAQATADGIAAFLG